VAPLEAFRAARSLYNAAPRTFRTATLPAMGSSHASPSINPVDAVAACLLAARRDKAFADDLACRGLLATVEQAYQVQDRVFAALEPSDAVALYWKSGAASRQEALRHAPLASEDVWASGTALGGLAGRSCLVEAELALRLGRIVSAADARELTQADALACVDAMAVSIELLAGRWASGRGAPSLLKLADSLMHSALVLGTFSVFAPRRWEDQTCCVSIGDEAPLTFVGSHGLSDPTFVLPAWLRHVTRHGQSARAGTVVSCGSWCGMLTGQSGDLVCVDFAGIGQCSVRL
jgi:2-keto-4-pentenoate hydratase